LAEIAPRMDMAQLCGGVGSVSSLGPRGLEVQRRFAERLGLRAPVISWTSSRDVLAFPQTQKASDLMTGAPSSVETKQLVELGVRVIVPPPKPA
jgi:hypothetical protein